MTFLLFDFFLNYSNLDPLTETYGLSFYMQYLAHWPEYFQVAESPSGEIMGYSKWIWILCSFKFAQFRLDLCLSNNCLRCIWLEWNYLLLVLWRHLAWNKTNWIFFLHLLWTETEDHIYAHFLIYSIFIQIVMGKAEGHGENWHGHVTALTVSPDYRRNLFNFDFFELLWIVKINVSFHSILALSIGLGLAATLMNFLENVSEK